MMMPSRENVLSSSSCFFFVLLGVGPRARARAPEFPSRLSFFSAAVTLLSLLSIVYRYAFAHEMVHRLLFFDLLSLSTRFVSLLGEVQESRVSLMWK